MLGLLTSRIGGYLIAIVVVSVVIGGVVLHMRATANTVTALREQVELLGVQAASLKTANDAMAADIKAVQQAQDTANHTIADIRAKAVVAGQTARSRTFDPGNNAAIQLQINKETDNGWKRLEGASRAP